MKNFNDIYNQNYRKIYGVACNMLHDSDDARDVIQDIFIYLHKVLKKGKIIEKPPNWLMRVTINRCIDLLNNRKKFCTEEHIPIVVTEEKILEKKQDREILKEALKQLNPKERALATLYGEGASYKEMAEITGIKFTSIGGTLSRTLKKLNEILKTLHYDLH
ncbi:sigma-70 family RNA polymerase sigma factor [Halosquirtibacter laminarini]|uniref:Sigma-70 family RNA polymerase sigma factor n=1 Tax=Halosquirtibacter laminarini TaxID=3374600 RepID=A0AC61NL91_9BACT|nr:sigma-70 family RNA polymerase sigma factor [Prolixibacteraceae bacterium]